MKTFVSYIIQNNGMHSHKSEVVETSTPPYSFSSDPPVDEILKWAREKELSLENDEKLIVLNMLKI